MRRCEGIFIIVPRITAVRLHIDTFLCVDKQLEHGIMASNLSNNRLPPVWFKDGMHDIC